jgi:hypothetical protein
VGAVAAVALAAVLLPKGSDTPAELPVAAEAPPEEMGAPAPPPEGVVPKDDDRKNNEAADPEVPAPGTQPVLPEQAAPAPSRPVRPILEREVQRPIIAVPDRQIVTRPPVAPPITRVPALPPLEFIVKIDDPVAAEIARLWRSDPEGARAAFTRFAADKPDLAGLRLSGANFSGELLIAQDAPRSPLERSAASTRTLERLRGLKGVAYADANASAQPGTTP